MKVITYTLEPDGTVPDFVTDGGYFPAPSGEASPQDWVLVGAATDDAPATALASAGALETYLVSIGADEWTDRSGQPVDVAALAATAYARLTQ